MKIFDGVTVNPATLSPTWQGVLGVAMLLANSFAEAEKIRDERVARAQAQTPRQEPTTLSDVMEQSGLKLPQLHDALTAFMGGTDEAKEAATLIVNTPDPVKLLREFARQYTPACAANGPIVTPPPAAAPTRPMPAQPAPATTTSSKEGATGSSQQPELAKFRPEFTREAREAAKQAEGPRPELAKFRPEFTREGREAAAKAAAAPSTSSPAAPRPASPTGPGAAPGRSLADMLEERLAILTRQADAHQAELHSRIRCAEAELAQLEEELQDLRVMGYERPTLLLISSTDEALPSSAATPNADGPTMPTDLVAEVAEEGDDPHQELRPESAASVAGEPDDEPAAAQIIPPDDPEALVGEEPAGGATKSVADEASPAADQQPLPPAGSNEEVARAYDMLGKFADRLEARYASDSEQVRALERRISVMRGRVEQVRGGSAARRG